jgi:hypothetical protein
MLIERLPKVDLRQRSQPLRTLTFAHSPNLAMAAAFRYRAATRVDTLGGNAAESRLTRRLSTFTGKQARGRSS